MDEHTDIYEEMAHFNEAYSRIGMNGPSVHISFYNDFEEQEIPGELTLVGNKSWQVHVANAQGAG